jgi:hypothetical protein
MISQSEEVRSVYFPDFPRDRFILQKDNLSFLFVTRPTEDNRYLQFEFAEARQILTDVLTPSELIRLDSGCIIEVWGQEIRSVVLEEFWKKSQPVLPARTSNLMEAML